MTKYHLIFHIYRVSIGNFLKAIPYSCKIRFPDAMARLRNPLQHANSPQAYESELTLGFASL
ncbi:hypothetical protein KUV50_07615 [Membranicola marinus]|uniref:Uncharacterized protein n=1 Tax=Membranihabitans marinus TaxID=1227546 RepID=A0A953HWR4_9BACT|nr:hypothetical protein [Membranihabitans marinus]MBY5957991.1 hypothetical protein [Membranihabitans marinus]